MQRVFFVLLALRIGLVAQSEEGEPEFQGPSHRILFGSCSNVKKRRHLSPPLWSHILERKPELWIWGGDNVYADIRKFSSDRLYRCLKGLPGAIPSSKEIKKHCNPFDPAGEEEFVSHYGALTAEPGYIALKETGIPIIGIWDDHDYGFNDGDGDYINKVLSKKYFWDFLEEPEDSPLRDRNGVYSGHDFVYEGVGKVQIILLDVRYNQNHERQELLGPEQWSWLEGVIADESPEVRIIMSGIQIFQQARMIGEAWSRFPADRERLLNLSLHSVVPTIFLAGDVHFAEFAKLTCTQRGTGLKRDLVEFTSSGMTHSWDQQVGANLYPWPAIVMFKIFMSLEPEGIQISNYMDLNFGEIELGRGPGKQLLARLRSHGTDGEAMSITVPLDRADGSSQSGDWDCRPWRGYTRTEYLARYAAVLLCCLIFLSSPCIFGCFFWRWWRRRDYNYWQVAGMLVVVAVAVAIAAKAMVPATY